MYDLLVVAMHYRFKDMYFPGFAEMCLGQEAATRVFCKERVLRNLTKFRGKHLCQSLFFNKVCNFIKK